MTHDGGPATEQLAALRAELAALREENARLRDLLGLDRRATAEQAAAWTPTLFTDDHRSTPAPTGVERSSPHEEKVALFGSLFAGRDDVHALRWENKRTGKAGWGRRFGAVGPTLGARTASTCR